jgi:NADPH:quinone reductase-like Zn-dependent oxidoreductase
MRAWVRERYGSVEQLRLVDVAAPVPAAGEVLIQVVTTSINLSDWESLRGSPGYARFGGLRRILGSDVAGRVTAVGPGVEKFRVGDEVYGDSMPKFGGFAEYIVMPASAVAAKPGGLGFAEASAIPQAGAIAREAVALAQPGTRMLINGAGGGSGSLLIQLAVAKGVQVTAVDNAGKLDFLRELGAHEVIDYRASDPYRTGPYDLIVDMVAHRSVFTYRRALARGGRFVMVGGTLRALFRMVTIGPLVGALTGRKLGLLLVHTGPTHFAALGERVVAGEIDVHIDRELPFEELPAALALHGEGRALGKVIVRVRDEA